MKVKLVLLLFLLLLGLHSCTLGSVDYRADEGKVIVRPDWSGCALSDLPAGTKFYFYNTNGTSEPIEADGSSEGYVGLLPAGIYKMVAYNTDATMVEFQAMNKFETAAVHAMPNTRRSAVTRDGDVRCIMQPENLYALTLGKVEVKYMGTTEVSVIPQPLIKTIRLQFTLSGDGVGDSKRVSGELCGIYSTLLLATGQPTAESVNNCPNTTTAFDVKLEENKGVAEVKIFGLLDPEDGSNYTNRLNIEVTDKKNQVRNAEVDLSEAISGVIKDNGGTIPVEIPIEIEVEVKMINTTLSVTVKPWKQSTGSGEV